MHNRCFLLAFLALAALAQKSDRGFSRNTQFEEHPALTLSNDKLELTVLPLGGAMVNLTLSDDSAKTSPLWNPIRMAREAGQKPTFGSSLGHFVCVDGFGPVSPEERAAGLNGHGEAHQQPWQVRVSAKEGSTATLSFTAKLPIVHELFTRTLRMVDGENVIYVQSELENELAFDHPVCWAEHATIGSPFLEPGVTVVEMSAKPAKTRTYQPGARVGQMPHRLKSGIDFTWPMAPTVDGGKVDVRNTPANPNSGDHTASMMDTSRKVAYVTAFHPGKGLLLGYLFKPEEFPWTQSWEFYPPNGKLARGLEFSTQPFDVPRREAVQTNTLFDAPTYRWLPAKSKIESRFAIFYTRVPDGFRKVDDVVLDGGRIRIFDRKSGKQIELAASLPL